MGHANRVAERRTLISGGSGASPWLIHVLLIVCRLIVVKPNIFVTCPRRAVPMATSTAETFFFHLDERSGNAEGLSAYPKSNSRTSPGFTEPTLAPSRGANATRPS